jgi:hypothetical protein
VAKQLPKLVLGTNPKTGEEVVVKAEHRARGMLIAGQPGVGKSTLTASLILQEIEAGVPVLVIDPHTLVPDLLQRIPKSQMHRVVLTSLRIDTPPLWPILDIAHRDDEYLVVAQQLTEAWRAQYGDESVGPRADSVLAKALLTMPRREGISPVELLAILQLEAYRALALKEHRGNSRAFGLHAYWEGTVQHIGERVFQEWAQAVLNKLMPLDDFDWLRLATSGSPSGRSAHQMPLDLLWEKGGPTSPITEVAYVRDGCIEVRRAEMPDEDPFVAAVAGNALDRYLLTKASGGMVRAPAFPHGVRADTNAIDEDVNADELKMPEIEELRLYGPDLLAQVMRRRRRRAWRRAIDYDFAPRGIVAREAIDIADLLDDGRIVLVEVPATYGAKVTQMVATFALLAAVLRGHRQIRLPENRRVPVSIWVDEAKLFLNSGIETTLTELRKAGTAMQLVLQRLGQMGPAHTPLRQAVLDTVGTVVATPMGRGEVRELSEMMEVSMEEARALERGQAWVSGLTDEWAQAPSQRFNFKILPPPVEDLSSEIRRLSVVRFHHSVADAERVYEGRVRFILKHDSDERERRAFLKGQQQVRSKRPGAGAGGGEAAPKRSRARTGDDGSPAGSMADAGDGSYDGDDGSGGGEFD